EDFFNDDFFSGRTEVVAKTVRTEEASLQVRPLPRDGKPKNFTGLVGDFQLNADVSKTDLATGDSATLTITLRGQGLVEGLGDIDLGVPKTIKVYPDKPTSEQSIDAEHGLYGKKIYRFALVPTTPGQHDLGELTIPAFVPKLGTYVTLKADLGQINATGSAASTSTDGGDAVKM